VLELSDACRRRIADDDDAALPVPGELLETRSLAESFNALLAGLRRARERQAVALQEEQRTARLHRRFLRRLGQEFGAPLRDLVAAVDEIAEEQSGDDRVARLRRAAVSLEEELAAILGITAEHDDEPGAAPRDGPLDSYLAEIADLLRPLARRLQVQLEVTADSAALRCDAELLTPVLVNLLANALRASAAGGRVELTGEIDGEQCRITVRDHGSGFSDELAESLRAACRRGEVAPGAAGFGLGLPLCLANLRLLGGTLTLDEHGADGALLTVRVPVG